MTYRQNAQKNVARQGVIHTIIDVVVPALEKKLLNLGQ